MVVLIRSLLRTTAMNDKTNTTSSTTIHRDTLTNHTQTEAGSDDETDTNNIEGTNTMLNYIDPGIRIFALTLTGMAVVGTIYCIVWFHQHKKERIVQSHQPEFLLVICFGILLWEISVIPLSIDDSIVSERGCSIACVATQWLYNIGFTISFAGLYSKLWRINKIFHNPQFRRISVTVLDVLKPFAILFSYTFIILVVWTSIDPPHWERVQIEETYTYGSCQSGRIGELLDWLLFTGHILVVLATIRQAYMARNVSSDFSETWPLALGLLNWIQLSIIGIPVRALIDYIVPSASYFLGVSVLLAQSLTMLLAIFCPLYLHPSIRHPPPALGHTVRVTRSEHHRVNITGTTYNESTIHNEDEVYHDAVIDHLGSSSILSTANHTTPDKPLKTDDDKHRISQLPHETVLEPIVESSSEMKDSSSSMNNNISASSTATNHNNNNNIHPSMVVMEVEEEEEEETV